MPHGPMQIPCCGTIGAKRKVFDMKKSLLILGAGDHGQVVRETAQAMGCFSSIAFLDDSQTGPDILDICENFRRYQDQYSDMFPAFGDGTLRIEWIARLEQQEITIPTLVHPTAYVSPSASIYPAAVVSPMAAVHTAAVVEKGCILGVGAVVDHDTLVGYGCHIDSGAVVSARCMVPALRKVSAGGVWTLAESEAYVHSMEETRKSEGCEHWAKTT